MNHMLQLEIFTRPHTQVTRSLHFRMSVRVIRVEVRRSISYLGTARVRAPLHVCCTDGEYDDDDNNISSSFQLYKKVC